MTTAIIDPRPDAFIQVDATGVITEWGLEAQRTYGWLREEILGRSAELLFPENQRGLCRKLLYEWPGSEKDIICGSPFEGLALHRDGAVFPVEVTVLRIQSAGFGIALFVRDRSGSRRLQTELARSESRYRAILEKLALEHRRLTDHLAFQASHDSLTGLPNRSRFEKKLREAMTRTDPGNDSRQAALICLDLDRFKSVNDMLGHPVGDLLLREVSRRFLSAIPAACTLARLAGDAFGVVVPDSGLRQARCLAQQLQNSLKTPLIVAGHQLRLSASVGIAMYPADGADQISLLRNADQAMYRAKIRDPGEVRFYCREMGEEESEKVEIENHLRVALDRGGLEIFYQPQFTSEGELSGLEALLRFRPGARLGAAQPFHSHCRKNRLDRCHGDVGFA